MQQIWAISDAGMAEAVSPLCRLASQTKPAKLSTDPHGSVAVVPIVGVLTPNGLTDQWRGSEGTSTAALIATVDYLRTDPATSAVMFAVDSPGGSVGLIPEAGDAIARLRDAKPTMAFVPGGLCCSGAYWLAARAGRIVATRGATLGSIGVYAAILDVSTALDRAGVKVHILRSTPLKGIGTPVEALTDAARSELQRHVDGLHALFAQTIAASRSLDPKRLETVATGQVWRADEALRMGLIDNVVGDLPEAITRAGWSAFLDSKPDRRAGTYDTRRHLPLHMIG